MTHYFWKCLERSRRVLPFALGSMLLSASAWLPVAAQISQIPLLTQKGSVEPNLVLMFDDSASMPAQFIYQYGGSEGVYGRDGPGSASNSATCPGTLSITITCSYNAPASTEYAQLSPDVNGLYYDPRVPYPPRVDAVGSTAASLTAVGVPPTTTFYVYFYKNGTTNLNVPWPGTITAAGAAPYRDPLNSSAYFTPSITQAQFGATASSQLMTGATTGLVYPNAVATATGPFPRFVGRTDCNGGAPTGGSCSLAEERLNYAIWKKYHSNRLDLAKTGLGWAFQDLTATLRLGWGIINTLDGGTLDSGVGLYNTARKAAFYTWLYARTGTVPGTPNRLALKTVGNYYSRADNKGPWAANPDTASTGSVTLTNAAAGDTRAIRKSHFSCRRSYAMLVTDGYYNDGSPGVNDVDGVAITAITGSDAAGTALTYNYNGTTLPYAQAARTNTFADVAMKYWITDLRPGETSDNTNDGISNKVKVIPDTTVGGVTTKGNESFWQNMSFYAVGLGVYGTLPQTATTLANLTAGVANTTTLGASIVGWPTESTNDETSVDDMWHATINGRGKMLSAKNSDVLSDAVEGMLAEINKDTSSQSGVAASTVSLVSSTKKYTPSYTTGSWTGNIVSTELDNTGAETCINWKVVGSATAAGLPSANPYVPPTCNAANTTYGGIPAHGSRNIYAWNGTAFGAFNTSNTYVNANVVGASTNLINYLRGDQSMEDTASVTRTYRQREYLLGDIVNSTPSFIQAALDMKYDKLPSATYGQSAYKAFLKTKMRPCTLSIITDCDATGLRPEGVLFAGANDGMLHGFRDSTGDEAFAFVPRAVMPNMHLLASRSYNHNYYVDGPTVEADACLTGGTACTTWSNLLLGTLGAGGKEVYALDVTTLTPGTTMGLSASSIKWEITTATANFANLGNILTEVQTGLTMSGHWVAVFGNGYYGADGKAYLYVVDLTTGLLVSGSNPIATNAATSNGLGGVRLVYNDNESDRRIVGAYAGDLKGNMWKFDLKDTNPAQWKLGINGAALFTATASPTQPITAAPTVVAHPTSGVVVAFGTGKLFDASPDDFGNTNVQSLYGVWDTVPFGSPTTGSTLSGTNTVGSTLVLQTISAAVSGLNVVSSAAGATSTSTVNYYSVSTNAIDWTSNRGWYINLTNLGQRVIYSLETLIGRYAAVDTISPSNLSIDPCTTAGTAKAWNYVIDMVTGGGTKEAIYDTNGDGVVDASDAIVSGYENSADGRTRYLKNAIVSTSDADWGYGSTGKGGTTGGSIVFVGLSTQQLPQTKINVAGSCIKDCTTPSGITKVVKRTWRQLFLR